MVDLRKAVNRQNDVLQETVRSLRDLTGQLIEGSHLPNRMQLLRALAAIEAANEVLPPSEQVCDAPRLRKRVMDGMPGSA